MTDDRKALREKWLEQANILTEALPFMRRYAGHTFVIKYGGHAMVDENLKKQFALDVILLNQIGVNVVIIHGGGPQIGALLDKMGIKSEFKGGLRVTDQATVEIVEMVLAGSINKQIVAAISEATRPADPAPITTTLVSKVAGRLKAERRRRALRRFVTARARRGNSSQTTSRVCASIRAAASKLRARTKRDTSLRAEDSAASYPAA